MGREVRMVPLDWEHPKNKKGNFIPLLGDFQEDMKIFQAYVAQDGMEQAVEGWGEQPPNAKNYMPQWPAEKATHYQMYEDTSEGTPISPPMPDPESLARWLVKHHVSVLGHRTATHEQWLDVIGEDRSVSIVMTNRGIRAVSGADSDSAPTP